MPKAKRMLAGRCYPVIAGSRDCVTNETDAFFLFYRLKGRADPIAVSSAGDRNSVIVTMRCTKWLDHAFFRSLSQFCRPAQFPTHGGQDTARVTRSRKPR
jgi:hypothetical protein